MPTDPIPPISGIGVGELVRLRTEIPPRRPWTVVAVGRRWWWKGKLKIVCQPGGHRGYRFVAWVYPAEVERATDGER